MERSTAKVLGIGCGLMLLLAVALALAVHFGLKDAPPVQDDDLIVAREDLPDDENAFLILKDAGELVDWPQDEADELRVRSMLGGEEWDAAFVADLLGRNAAAFERLEQGLACRQCQAPPFSNAGDPLDYLDGWRNLARLPLLRAEQHLKEGRHPQAAEAAMTAVRFGHVIEGSGASLIHYLTGSAIKTLGIEPLRELARCKTVPPALLRECARELGQYGAHVQGLQDAARGEYAGIRSMIDDLAAGTLTPGDLTGGPKRARVRKGFFFRPEKTKAVFAQAQRTFIENVPRTYAERDFSGMPQVPSGGGANIKLILSGNAIGRTLASMLMPALEGMQTSKCEENVRVGLTQLHLALRAYTLETGALPRTLNELLPEYLKAVPVDDFDGKPIRYAPEKRLVYSVGHDLIDSGGDASESNRQPLDIVLELGF